MEQGLVRKPSAMKIDALWGPSIASNKTRNAVKRETERGHCFLQLNFRMLSLLSDCYCSTGAAAHCVCASCVFSNLRRSNPVPPVCRITSLSNEVLIRFYHIIKLIKQIRVVVEKKTELVASVIYDLLGFAQAVILFKIASQ